MEVREMATATIAAPTILLFPEVPTDQITQEELTELVGAQKTLEKLARLVQDAEASLLARLRNGVAIQNGQYLPEVKRNARRSPSWKNIVKRLAGRLGLDGDAYRSNVIAHTKPSESFSLGIHVQSSGARAAVLRGPLVTWASP
jgi:hypothetical protein